MSEPKPEKPSRFYRLGRAYGASKQSLETGRESRERLAYLKEEEYQRGRKAKVLKLERAAAYADERREEKMRAESARARIPPSRFRRFASGAFKATYGSKRKKTSSRRKSPPKKLPYHHGQHKRKADKQCKAYRKHQRVLNARRRLQRELNR